MASKKCPKCGERQPISAFGRNRTQPDGLSFYCLACNRERNREWYRASREADGHTVRDLTWVPEGSRWCPTCRCAVPVEEFGRNARSASGFGSRCRACSREANNEGYFVRKYGLSRAAVEKLRTAQGDVCAICGDPGPGHLDHDHDTGRVRSLLCERCNLGLGLFRDRPDLLRAAADYVEEHAARAPVEDVSSPTPSPPTSGSDQAPPVGSRRRPPQWLRAGLCERGRASLAAREADG